MNRCDIVALMKDCPQTQNQSVYDHGVSVNKYFWELYGGLKDGSSEIPGWKLPSWSLDYREEILANLFSAEIINDYTIFHDCGKLECRTVDRDHKIHNPGDIRSLISGRTRYVNGWSIYDGSETCPAAKNSKVFNIKLLSPDGTVYGPISNLAEFCRRHNLNQSSMQRIITGKHKSNHKGWTMVSPNNGEKK